MKLGQYVAQLDYLVPPPYISTLEVLFSHNHVSPWEDVAATITTDLGAHPDELFASIDREPIASASLAQVHRATARGAGSSRALAVKVQHTGLREACGADLAAVGVAVRAAAYLFPDDFVLHWMWEEMATFLPQALGFTS